METLRFTFIVETLLALEWLKEMELAHVTYK
jgi:hypothetical protein